LYHAAPHRTAPHRTSPSRAAPRRAAPRQAAPRRGTLVNRLRDSRTLLFEELFEMKFLTDR